MNTYWTQSLDNLKEWLQDSIDADIPPSMIFNAIKEVIEESENDLRKKMHSIQSLKNLLQQNNRPEINFCQEGGSSNSWDSFWGSNISSCGGDMESEEQNTESFSIPVEVDDVSGEFYITFPEDLMQKLGWKEGDDVLFTDNNDKTFSIKKIS